MTPSLSVHNPYDRSCIQELPLADAKAVENALALAHATATQKQPLPKHERIQQLKKLQVLITEEFEEFVLLATKEGGKPYKDSIVEVQRAINGIELAIGELLHFAGNEIPM